MKVCAQPKNQQKHNRPAACLVYFWIRNYFQPAPSARETYGQPAKAAGLRPAQRAAGIVIDATWQPVKGCFWQKNVFGFFRRPQNVFIIARLFRRQYGLYSLLLRGFYAAIMTKRPSECFFRRPLQRVGRMLESDTCLKSKHIARIRPCGQMSDSSIRPTAVLRGLN